MMVVFIVFFGCMGSVEESSVLYLVFVFFGLVFWVFFVILILFVGNSVVGLEKLIIKIYFFCLVIFVVVIGFFFVDVLIVLVLMLLMIFGIGMLLGVGWLFVFLVLFLVGMVVIGIGMWFVVLNVEYWDFCYVILFFV